MLKTGPDVTGLSRMEAREARRRRLRGTMTVEVSMADEQADGSARG